jgi:deoxyribodipyrimidine photo-lyase
MSVTVFWFRRDLRLEDNTALHAATRQGKKVLPLFIFDEQILSELPPDDARVSFIYDRLEEINNTLTTHGSSLLIGKGKIDEVWETLLANFTIDSVYVNRDYEPYATQRDLRIKTLLEAKGIPMFSFKDQVVHEQHEVMKQDGTPYTVYTPYKNKWLAMFKPGEGTSMLKVDNFHRTQTFFPKREHLGLQKSSIKVRDFSLDDVQQYAETRNIPSLDSTSYLGPHLRFGTVSVRQIISQLNGQSPTFLSELIWREFFMQILFHFPHVVTQSFRSKYAGIQWRNDENDFEKWCKGETGYPLVDAGMRQLNATGYMHNRVRMVTAGFLCKHLLIDWRLGEAYFAQKLLDYDLASNNGNWQWAAGTGCDAAPYFRIFNPSTQMTRFDNAERYVKKWVKEWGSAQYPAEMVEHRFARERALALYKEGIGG